MARPIGKLHQEDVRRKYYVYEVLGPDGEIIYVGKGTGRRHLVSLKQRSGSSSRVVKYFDSEPAALRFEQRHIANAKPSLNLCKGGNGGRCAKKSPRKDSWQKAFDAIGSRRYAARLLLACYQSIARHSLQSFVIDTSKVGQIREVAYG